MLHRIWIDGEIVKEMNVEKFDMSMIPSDFLSHEFQNDIMIHALKHERKEAEKATCSDFSSFFESLDTPADDGFRVVWSGYYNHDSGFTSRDDAEKETIGYLF